MSHTSELPHGLDTYGLDYHDLPAGEVRADQNIRVSDRYVETRDLLRATTQVNSYVAAVSLGVDPGTFFCGAQFAGLIQLRKRPGFGDVHVGFIHVPPDRATGSKAQAKPQLHDREVNLEMIAQVVAVALRGLTQPAAAIVITGFGPFSGVADNPTQAFVDCPDTLDQTIALAHPGSQLVSSRDLDGTSGFRVGVRDYHISEHSQVLRVFSVLLELAPTVADALAGRYYDPDVVADSFTAVTDICCMNNNGIPPVGIVSLGVDSSQATGTHPPRFKVETQTRGWHREGVLGRHATEDFQRDLTLATIFLAAREQKAPPLRYSP